MQCPNCGKTERVTIGAKQYCSNCGKALANVDPATPSATPTSGAPMTMPHAGITAPTGTRPVMRDIAPSPAMTPTAAPATTMPAPTPVPTVAMPATPAPMPMPAVTAPAPSVSTPSAATQPNPAGSFHARTSTPAGAPILDLSKMDTSAAPQSLAPAPHDLVKPPVTAAPATTVSTPTQSSPTSPVITRGSDTKFSNAQSIQQSGAISKFGSGASPRMDGMGSPQVAAQITPAPTASFSPTPTNTTPLPTANVVPGLENVIAETAAINKKLAPQQLPNAVVTQVDAMASANMTQGAAPKLMGTATSSSPKPQLKPATIAAALAAITIMGGYIWVNNYPKMTVKTAAAKAGIEATLPGYMPTNYSLAGQVGYAPGQITLNFNTSSHDQNVQITQRRTNWDSSSLLENYVAKTANQYSAVEGQGLTVYMFGASQASWVNHGIWYNIDGSNRLSRDQLLKIIYSL